MKQFESVLESETKEDVLFYLEYLDILIDFFKSRNIGVEELNEEKNILLKRVKEI